MPKRSLSEIKFSINDWILDELGLDGDRYVDLINSGTTWEDTNSIARDISQLLSTFDVDLCRRFTSYWTKLSE